VTDPDGRITGIHGLSTTPTAHRITHPGGDIYAWCAFDAIGIPAALDLDAHTHTTCPTCGQHLDIAFTGGQPTAHEDPRLWLPTMQRDNVLSAVCAHANLYCNHRHLTATVTNDAIGSIVTVPAAADLGRATWQDAATALQRT
jgi:alkylmercury lyase